MVHWRPFMWAAVAAAATAGFGYGTLAFAASALGSAPSWWPAVVQAHGHLQLFGWGGLMVLGVGFFFLPRLRGAPLAAPGLLPWILAFMVAGLLLRAASQPAVALQPSPPARAALALSGPLELLAATLAAGILVATARLGPPLGQRAGLVPVLPYIALSFAALWLSLGVNAVLAISSGLSGQPIIPAAGDDLTTQIALSGFLVPISVAVSARSFPLFLWLRVPSTRALQLALVPFLAGLLLRWWGAAGGPLPAAQLGELLEGASLIAFAAILQVVPTRRRAGVVPSEDRHYVRPVEYLLVPAYVWLVVAGLLDVASGTGAFGAGLSLSPDLERHALGSGFVTMLILGMGQRMLPGFSGRQLASVGLAWATAVLGNLSALLRVVPLLAVNVGWSLPFSAAGTMALAGALGLTAVICFALNLYRTFR